MDKERLSNELNDILIEFHNTLCNPSTPCKDCKINKYRKKYNVNSTCSAVYLAIKLLGATKDTAMFINKQDKIFKSSICNGNFNFCSNKCYIRNIRKRHTDNELGGSRGSCFYTYLGTILLNDI